ncbi:MAG: biotin transporter BioY [Coriobacteriia bacterium]|nr:biotin transporter BioY [Coriobacteriia bacterium]
MQSRAKSVAFIALSIAIMAVSAWITVSLGPIPFTLQMFAITFAIVVLRPSEAVCAIAGYLVLGAMGVPVFSGMRGGIGVLLGPTGGFLWGYFFGVTAAVALLYVYRKRVGQVALTQKQVAATSLAKDDLTTAQKVTTFFKAFGVELAAGILFTAISYVCGWAQYQVVAPATPEQTFLVCIAPFIAVDLCKIVVAVLVANAVKKAVGR